MTATFRGSQHAVVGRTAKWIFADATQRAAFVPSWGSRTPPAKEDVGAEAWQLSDDSFWALSDFSPITWVAKGAGGGSATTPSGLTPDFAANTTIAAAAGPPTATVDIPIATDGTTYTEIRATGVGQTSGKEVAYYCVVAVKRVSGTLSFPFGSFVEQVAPETGAFSGTTADSTWVARSLSASNIRLTLKGDTTEVVKWRVEADFRITPFPV